MPEKKPEKNVEDEFVESLPGGEFFHPASLTLDLDKLGAGYKKWNSHDHMENSIELLVMLPYAIAELRVARDLIEAMRKEKREQDEYHSMCRALIKEALGEDQASDEHWSFADFAKDIEAIRRERDNHQHTSGNWEKERHKILGEYVELVEVIMGIGCAALSHETIMKSAKTMKSHADVGSLHVPAPTT